MAAGRARFTVLTPSLVRAQWADDPSDFDDRATFTIVNRMLPVPNFTVARNGHTTTITTSALTLAFTDDGSPSPPPAASCSAARRWVDAYPQGGFVLTGTNATGDCCTACSATPGCTYWGKSSNGACSLFAGSFETRASSGREAGALPPRTSRFAARLTVTLASGGGSWMPGAVNRAQLNGTFGELGCYVDAMTCIASYWEQRMELGLVARSGIVAIDDGATPRLVDGSSVGANVPLWHAPPNAATEDVYLNAYESAYESFFRDWAQLSGGIALPRRSALGVWYGRYWPVSEGDEDEVIATYAALKLPLTGLMLDMDCALGAARVCRLACTLLFTVLTPSSPPRAYRAPRAVPVMGTVRVEHEPLSVTHCFYCARSRGRRCHAAGPRAEPLP